MRCPYCGFEGPEHMVFCGHCGRQISATSPLHGPSYGGRSFRPYNLRVNALCLIGAIMAVMSLFMPWAVVQENRSTTKIYIDALDFDSALAERVFSESTRLSISVFLIGAILALVTPVAGIPLSIGCAGFGLSVGLKSYANWQVVPWVGWVIASFSAISVVLSFLSPLGLGYERGQVHGALARLLTWSLYK